MKRMDAYGFADSGGYETREHGSELQFKFCPYCHGGMSRDQWTFSINLESGAYKCLRSSCNKQGHFVELCRDLDYPLEKDDMPIYKKYIPRLKNESKDAAIE